jgi:adenosine deaminase
VGALPSPAAHPLPRWLDAGLQVTVCSDNTLLSGVDARSEHRLAASLPGMTSARMDAVIAAGHRAAFRRGHFR